KRQSTLTGRSAFYGFMQLWLSCSRDAELQPKKKRIRTLLHRGLGSDTPCLVGRVALADFSCARRRGLAKIGARPLLLLGCFCRRQRLTCAAVQDSNEPCLLCPGQ